MAGAGGFSTAIEVLAGAAGAAGQPTLRHEFVAGPTLYSKRQQDLTVVGLGLDQTARRRSWANMTWSNWTPLQSNETVPVSDLDGVALLDGTEFVVGLNSKREVVLARFVSGAWKPWQVLAPGVTWGAAPTIAANPTENRAWLFGIGSDGLVYSRWITATGVGSLTQVPLTDSGGTLLTTSTAPGFTSGIDAVGTDGVASVGGTRFYLTTRDLRGIAVVALDHTGDRFLKAPVLHLTEPAAGSAGSPCITAWSSERIDVYSRSADGKSELIHAFSDSAGAAFGPWERLGTATPGSGAIASDPDCTAQPGRQDVVARRAGGAVWNIWWVGGVWSSWDEMPKY